MNVNISDVIREQYLQPSGITEEDIRDAMFHEDIKKIIRLGQSLDVIYFLKKKSNHYLLVDGRWSSTNLSISAVFKILLTTIEEIGINNPLARYVYYFFPAEFGKIVLNFRKTEHDIRNVEDLAKETYSLVNLSV